MMLLAYILAIGRLARTFPTALVFCGLFVAYVIGRWDGQLRSRQILFERRPKTVYSGHGGSTLDSSNSFLDTGASTHPWPSTFSSCDPYSELSYFQLNITSPFNSTFISLSPTCQPSKPPYFNTLLQPDGFDNTTTITTAPVPPPIPELQNKSLLLIGDSVDRFTLIDLCGLLNGTLTIHSIYSYLKAPPPTSSTNLNSNGGLPRLCRIHGPSGKQNLTIANYFFYGYDEDDIWSDKLNTYVKPGRFTERWGAFRSAYESLWPSISEGVPGAGPDLVFVNTGLWELARYDRLLYKDSKLTVKNGVMEEADGSLESDPPILPEEFLAEYISNTVSFLGLIREVVGPRARIRWRQMHTPVVTGGVFFRDKGVGQDAKNNKKIKNTNKPPPKKNPLQRHTNKIYKNNDHIPAELIRISSDDSSHIKLLPPPPPPPPPKPKPPPPPPRSRFHAAKIRMLNEAAVYACRQASQLEVISRRGGGAGGNIAEGGGSANEEDGTITVFPVGDLVAPYAMQLLLRDDIHPSAHLGAWIWGGGMLEYLARTPGQ